MVNLNLDANDTYITNVEEFKKNLSEIEMDFNVTEYLENLVAYLDKSVYSNRGMVISAIKKKLDQEKAVEEDQHKMSM